MRVKLLKKVRKRGWVYFRKDKFPVLFIHEEQASRTYDLDYCIEITKTTDIESVEVDTHEWALRLLKRDFLKEYGYSFSRYQYRHYTKAYKRKIKQ